MSKLKFALELLVTLALIAGLIWAVSERMELRADSDRLAQERAMPLPVSGTTSTIVINPDGTTAGMPYSPGATDTLAGDASDSGAENGEGDGSNADNGAEEDEAGGEIQEENPPEE